MIGSSNRMPEPKPSSVRPTTKTLLILLVIVAVGVFFRTYHFHDWLQFSPDEARDATYISDALTGKAPLPKLGPQAGNTQFYLGPLYYQAEYVAGRVFGNAPDKIAYFDLLFSILAIPMLFFFLRKCFSDRISLFLTGVMSVSFFAIQISRFASNPNTIPFFVPLFLYGLLGLMGEERTKKWPYAVAVGIGMGVGIQLHTLLFLIMPCVGVCVAVFLFVKRSLSMRDLLIALFFFLLMNFGQIGFEIQSNGANISQLFKGAGSESSVGASTLVRNISLIASCQAQANVNIVFSVIDVQKCGGIFNIAKSFRANKYLPGTAILNGIVFIVEGIVTLLFSMVGYMFVLRSFRNEPDRSKRDFLGLVFFFNAVSFIALVPVASQIEVRYFSILSVVPFVLLGIILSALPKGRSGISFGTGFMLALLVANVLTLVVLAQPYLNGNASNVDNSILGETESMATYLETHTETRGAVFLDGQTFYLKRFLKPFEYLALQQGISITRPGSNEPFPSGTAYFFIDGVRSKPYALGDKLSGDVILGYERFGNIMIYSLVKTR